MQLFAVMKSWQGELIATSLFMIIFFHVIWIVTFTFVVYGGIKKKAWAFIPFLILFGLVTGIICMYIFYICIGSIYETIRKPDLVDETTGLIFILVTPALLLIWIYSIVLRAFNYVVDSNRAQVYKVVPTKEAV
uniref:Transmembrane protein 18 n=1 Tax=Acrobeloides nanus TaxID=290746 RepID=A0A914CTI0_9BILA